MIEDRFLSEARHFYLFLQSRGLTITVLLSSSASSKTIAQKKLSRTSLPQFSAFTKNRATFTPQQFNIPNSPFFHQPDEQQPLKRKTPKWRHKKPKNKKENAVASCQLQLFIASIFLVVVFVHARWSEDGKWTP
jgi:hypothetical protein